METRTEKAVNAYESGFNCAQSVFSAFCDDYGLERETALKLSCGLGGGCRSGEICGAVSGAVLVVGLKYGHCVSEDKASKSNCYAKTIEFINTFRAENNAIVCREILGCDISEKEGLERAQGANLFKTTCTSMVRSAVGILERLGY